MYTILGASGWIAHYLIPLIKELSPDSKITAVYRNHAPCFDQRGIDVISSEDFVKTLDSLEPSTLINLARGEEESDFEKHLNLIQIQNQRNCRYVYASSFNACDRNVSREHLETDRAESISSYGQFKARCEDALLAKCNSPVIFRFSSTHGWAPNRVARTEVFLKQLSANETFSIPKGIIQNRSFVGDLAMQIAMLATHQSAEGVFHLGSIDASDEIEFHYKLSNAFGYKNILIEKGEDINYNAVMTIDKLAKLFPNYHVPTEAESIIKIANQIQFNKYKKI